MSDNSKSSADGTTLYGPDRPYIPSERLAWFGLAATLLACLIVAICYFSFTGAKGL